MLILEKQRPRLTPGVLFSLDSVILHCKEGNFLLPNLRFPYSHEDTQEVKMGRNSCPLCLHTHLLALSRLSDAIVDSVRRT